MKNDLISRSALKKRFEELHLHPDLIELIDNAPTVDTACPHCDSGYAQGYSDGYLRGKGEITNEDIQQAIKEGFANGYEMAKAKLVKKLNDRVEKSVCKYCQMNKHCELCEISRVFQIIALTNEEMEEGAE